MEPFPPFAPFPLSGLRKRLLPDEWEQCLDSWIFLAHEYLLLPAELFSEQVLKEHSLFNFLIRYFRETTHTPDKNAKIKSKAETLKRKGFLLVHRILSEVKPIPTLLLEWTFWGDLSTRYAKSTSLRILLRSLWDKEDMDNNVSMQKSKISLTKVLEASGKIPKGIPMDSNEIFQRTGALLKSCYQYGQFLMLGTDLIDSLSTAYQQGSADLQKKLVAIAYLSLISLTEPSRPRISTLLDQLYNLDSYSHYKSLLAELCSKTPLLRKLRVRISGPEAARAQPLLQKLSGSETTKDRSGKSGSLMSRKIIKGKGKAHDEYGHGAMDNVHVHKMSLITQIQDLFPDLGSGFVIKLLDEYDDDTERVTAHLLEDSLPPHLQHADRTEQMSQLQRTDRSDPGANLAVGNTPPLAPVRRNIFDNDAFDRLEMSPSSVRPGHKDPSRTADAILTSDSSRPSKAAILSALAAFDSDDDERDDTYDIEDVGGTIDSAMPGSDEADADLEDKNEEALFAAWRMSPEVFNRDANTRRGKSRIALKSETAMTDEAIEGWAIMIGRDPRRLRRLEAKFSTFSGTQRELAPTAYRESPGGSAAEDSDGMGRGYQGGRGDRGGRGGFRGRGRGRGRGDVTGPADDRNTQVARQRKDTQKGSRANHNRRAQRARKMARGGFVG